MGSGFLAVAVARMDAGVEPAWKSLRRATVRNIEFMSGVKRSAITYQRSSWCAALFEITWEKI
jgi:hypothetical protein